MPDLDSQVRGIVAGDDISLRRTIGFTATGFETGVTIDEAWLTIKTAEADADPGLVQKIITTTDVPGTGEIETDGTGDVDMVVRFDLEPADTVLIGSVLRFFDIQVKTAGGLIYTPEKGRITTTSQVTKDS